MGYNRAMHIRCLINGEPGDSVAVSDRGLLYGDGLFETLAVRAGVCEFWDRHMQRLMHGCERLRIPAPDPDRLRDEAERLVAGQTRAVLKIVLTRGSGGRGYQTSGEARPTRILMRSDWPERPADLAVSGVQVRICAQRLSRNPSLAGLKHLNRLEQVLARLEWEAPEIAEGLMLDERGQVIEGTFTNVFAVRDGRLVTPVLDQCGVAGILRGVVMELATAQGIDCAEHAMPFEMLETADELFLTNSLIGVWPVCMLDARPYRSGPVTRQVQAAVEEFRLSQHVHHPHG